MRTATLANRQMRPTLMPLVMRAACFAAAHIFACITAAGTVQATNPPSTSIHELQRTGIISGQVQLPDNTPMSNAVAVLFDESQGPPPALDQYWRVPDLIIPLASDGKFSLQVVPGTYYLQIAQKRPESEIGPPRDSEYLYFHRGKGGNAEGIRIEAGSHRDLGKVVALLWTPDVARQARGGTSIAGQVLDQDGKPVVRAIVFAFLNQAASGRPTFVSERTGNDGTFILRVHDGGTFYLKVRSQLGGGRPGAGEYQNVTNEFKPEPVTLKKGEQRSGLVLKVKPFTRPAGRNQGEQDEKQKMKPAGKE